MRALGWAVAGIVIVGCAKSEPPPRQQVPAVTKDEIPHVERAEGAHLEEPLNVAKVTMTDVPQAVREAMNKARPGVKINNIDQATFKNGAVHYVFNYVTADGKESDVEFDVDGKLIDN